MPVSNPEHLLSLLQAFINAPSLAESRRIIEENPELLTPEADALLGRILEQYRDLLRRCREGGVEAAFAEKMGLPPGVDPLQAAAALRRAQDAVAQAQAAWPEDVRRELNELIKREGIRSLEELEAALEDHPDLREALAQAAQQAAPGSGLGEIPDDVRPILQELSQPARRADMPRRIQLCEQALNRVDQEVNPTLWAFLQGELANSLNQNPLGERAENLERVIHHNTQALEVYTRQAFPADWAMTQNNLAAAYAERVRGERAENLERAIRHYTLALEVWFFGISHGRGERLATNCTNGHEKPKD